MSDGGSGWVSAGTTDIGLVRARNEDAYAVDDALGCYLVADGMGGHAGGDVASRMTRDAVLNALRGAKVPSGKRRVDVLARAVAHANATVRHAAQQDPGLFEMGTTLTAIWRVPRGRLIAVAHVGDSRLYRLDAAGLECLTEDHTAAMEMVRQGKLTVEQARGLVLWHRLSRAVGSEKTVEIDGFAVGAAGTEALLLCTDGLNGMIADVEIERILRAQLPDPHAACEALVHAAIDAGGEDNVTVVVLYRVDP